MKSDLLDILGDQPVYEVSRLQSDAGVYILLDKAGTPIYVGESGTVQTRLGAHTNKDWQKAVVIPTGLAERSIRLQIESALMYLLHPVLNMRKTSATGRKVRNSYNLQGVEEDKVRLKEIVRRKMTMGDLQSYPMSPADNAAWAENDTAQKEGQRLQQQALWQDAPGAVFDGPKIVNTQGVPQVMLSKRVLEGVYPERHWGWKAFECCSDDSVFVNTAWYYVIPDYDMRRLAKSGTAAYYEGGKWVPISVGDTFQSRNQYSWIPNKLVTIENIHIHPCLNASMYVRYSASGHGRSFDVDAFSSGQLFPITEEALTLRYKAEGEEQEQAFEVAQECVRLLDNEYRESAPCES